MEEGGSVDYSTAFCGSLCEYVCVSLNVCVYLCMCVCITVCLCTFIPVCVCVRLFLCGEPRPDSNIFVMFINSKYV